MLIQGINPGGFHTVSDVTVADRYMYFRGTDNKVWRVNAQDGSDNSNPGGFTTLSNVFVADGYMYFRGTDNTIWKVNALNPGDSSNFDPFKTISDVNNPDGYLYFRGTDNKVWRVNVFDVSDNSNPGGFTTLSNVSVADGYMYFRGTDNKVWRVNVLDASDNSNPGGFTTLSNVLVDNGYMYFRGTDNTVWQVNALNPSDNSNTYPFKTLSDVFFDDGALYFRGTDDAVWVVNAGDPTFNSNPGGFKTQSNVIYSDSAIYFQGTDQKVWEYEFYDGLIPAYAHAAAEALQTWYNWNEDFWGHGAGQWNGTGWWNAANALNALIDYMSLTNSGAYLGIVEHTFNACNSGNFLNSYYDDEGWWALTWINAYDLTQDPTYLQMAVTIFNDMTGGWDNVFNGGIYWKKDGTDDNGHSPYKNAIPNELFLTIAARLYLRTANADYMFWATREVAWFNGSGLINPEGLVIDALPCLGNGTTQDIWTYNQGVILGGLVDLNLATLEPQYLTAAQQIADAAISTLIGNNGILRENCEASNSCGGGVSNFKGAFIRNLGYLHSATLTPGYQTFIQTNAQCILENNRNGANQFGLNWSGPVDSVDASRQTSALDCLNAAMRVSGM